MFVYTQFSLSCKIKLHNEDYSRKWTKEDKIINTIYLGGKVCE